MKQVPTLTVGTLLDPYRHDASAAEVPLQIVINGTEHSIYTAIERRTADGSKLQYLALCTDGQDDGNGPVTLGDYIRYIRVKVIDINTQLFIQHNKLYWGVSYIELVKDKKTGVCLAVSLVHKSATLAPGSHAVN